jgi:hypothetical protein
MQEKSFWNLDYGLQVVVGQGFGATNILGNLSKNGVWEGRFATVR